MRPGDAAAMATAAALAAVLCVAAIAYGRRRGLLDQPGPRRSHAVPTPRGGGVGVVLSLLLFGLAPAAWAGDAVAAWIGVALAAVAAVGWWDDHRPLSVRVRLAVHLAASTLAALAVLGVPADVAGAGVLVGAVAALAWSTNLHNFVDGIDGLLGLQALAGFAILAALAAAGGDEPLARCCMVACAACAGFLPFNLPQARIFLGDVGSGAIGLALGAFSLLGWRRGVIDPGAALIVLSACGVDATATLLWRIARGRRWWRPHREHLYQWLVRCGWTHAATAGLYFGWTALVAPAVLCARELAARSEWSEAHPVAAESLYFVGWPAATLLAALGLWLAGRRACRRRARTRRP